MIKRVLAIWFIFSISISNANVKTDSSLIAELFTSALQNQNIKDSLVDQASSIYQKNKNNILIEDTYLFNLAKYLFQTSQLDSAYQIAKQGQKLYQTELYNYKNAKFYNVIGAIYAYQKKYKLAIEEFNKAIKVFDFNNDPYQVALIKNNIANIFFSLLDYENAYKYSKESYTYLKSINDTLYLPTLTAVTSISANGINNLEEGFLLANEGLELSIKHNNVLGIILGDYALGDYYLKTNDYDSAEDFFLKSLDLCETYQLIQYSLLNQTGLLIANEFNGDYKSAVKFGETALENSKTLKNFGIQYSIHKHLGRAYAGVKKYKKAFKNINKAHEIYLETSNTDTKKSINDLLIKYETEKKEKEIISKNLQITKEELKLSKLWTWIYGLIVIFIGVVIFYLFYTKSQKKVRKKQQETIELLALIEGEEKERQRLSDELHDGVASRITGIKFKLEHLINHPNKTELNDLTKQLSELHEETRRISHNLMPASLKLNNFNSVLKLYCDENSHQNFKINFFDATNTEIVLEDKIKNVLYRVVQELINNVQKHSKSNVCFVQLSQTTDELVITVEDEGIGFDVNIKLESQGIKSIKNRIEKLKGSFKIESKSAKGTLVIIHIPLK